MDIINRIISTIISKYGGFFMDLKKSIRIVEDFLSQVSVLRILQL